MLGQNAVWGLTVQIGPKTGRALAEISWILALTALIGLGGAALATNLNVRWGRTPPSCIQAHFASGASQLQLRSTRPTDAYTASGSANPSR